jgi:dynein heavy chain
VRTTPPGKGVKLDSGNDNEVLFGEISEHTITSLNVVINQVFKPLVDRLDNTDWQSCEDEQKREFTQVFDKFANELKDALKSIQSNISLEAYDKKWENDAKITPNTKSLNPDMIADFERLFNDWSEKIAAAIEETENERKEDKEAGPRNEIEFWRQRMRKLTGISEQLKSKNCRTVIDVLDTSQKPGGEQSLGKPREKLNMALQNWRSLEIKVTENLNEAKDNVKYLSTLDKFIEPLYDGTPDSIKDTLPALMNSIKMIHTIARYYNTNDRMTGLFVKITQQMINNCKHNILYFRRIKEGTMNQGKKIINDDVLWNHDDYPPEELIPVLKSCLELNQAYQKQYEITKERLMNMPKGKQFEFSPNQIFGKFDLFCRRVSKLIELFGTIQQFRTLEKHNLENIGGILQQFNGYVSSFKKKNHKLLDFHNNTFDRDFVEFNVDVSNVETELQRYIDKNFEVITSIEDSLKLLRKFQAIL